MLDICLLGTGGMLPLPNRFLTSLYVKYGGKALLIDCGEGTQISMRKNKCSFKDIDLIYITHFHADHISGLPGLLLSMGNSDRTEPVTIAGPKGLFQILTGLLIIAPDLPFDIYVHEIDADKPPLTLGSMSIHPFSLEHRIPCLGYRIEIPRAGKFQPEKAAALGIPKEQWSHLQNGSPIISGDKKITPEMVLGPTRKGIKLLYATDTLPLPIIADEGANADLLILEGIYGEKEKEEKARQRCHMTFTQAASLAKQANAAELWLTHFSPSLTVPAEFLPAAKEIFPNTISGYDGMNKTLKFTD